jgi:hypothetical protein
VKNYKTLNIGSFLRRLSRPMSWPAFFAVSPPVVAGFPPRRSQSQKNTKSVRKDVDDDILIHLTLKIVTRDQPLRGWGVVKACLKAAADNDFSYVVVWSNDCRSEGPEYFQIESKPNMKSSIPSLGVVPHSSNRFHIQLTLGAVIQLLPQRTQRKKV